MLMMSGMEMSHAGRSDSRLVGETPKHINDDQTTVPHELEKREGRAANTCHNLTV